MEPPKKVAPEALKNLLKDFKDLFPDSIPGLPSDRGVQLSILLIEGAEPVRQPMFNYNPMERKETEEQVEYLLERLDCRKLESFRCTNFICTEAKQHSSDVYGL